MNKSSHHLLDEYIQLKDQYKALAPRAKGRKVLKRRYQKLEHRIISEIPEEYLYRDRILIKGRNDYGEHIQVFTKESLQKWRNYQEVLGHSERLRRIIEEEE
jgi:hypothetical protein